MYLMRDPHRFVDDRISLLQIDSGESSLLNRIARFESVLKTKHGSNWPPVKLFVWIPHSSAVDAFDWQLKAFGNARVVQK